MNPAFKPRLAIFSLLAIPALLHAQPTTPTISSLQSGNFSATHGAAITAGTPLPNGIQLYINGNFNPYSYLESVTWTENSVATSLYLIGETTTQLVANVPMSLFTSPGSASITVTETPYSGLDLTNPSARRAGPRAVSNAATFTVNPAMAQIGVLPSGRVGVAYAQAFFSGGTAPFTVQFSSSPAPPGLSATASTGNPLAGTPTQVGVYTVNPTITDSWNNVYTPNDSLTVLTSLLITTSGLPSGTVGQGYSGAVSASGGSLPYSWTATGLPGGLSISPTSGVIAGAPLSSGTFSVTVRVTDYLGSIAQATYTLLISPAPQPPLQITTTSLASGMVGQIYAGVIAATGGTGGYVFSTTGGSLPPGVQLATAGQIYGTPSAPGIYSFTVVVTDSSQSTASRAFSIQISPAPLVLTGAAPATVPLNATISTKFGATGGVAPYTITLTGTPPPGTSFGGGTLSGTATTAGSFSFTVTASDSQQPPATASQSFTITVTPAPLTITASLPGGQVGQAYSGQFSASGGVGPYSWTGSAGGGLSVSSTGAVGGTPSAPGTVAVAVTVTDSTGTKASGSYSITITEPSLTITTTSLPSGSLTASYSAALNATGGTTPYTWSASGLPGGLSISSGGAISGTPTSLGTFTVSVTVKDAGGLTATAGLALTVNPAPLKITTTGISPPVLGASFSLGFGATGGTPPYVWTATGLPPGVTFTSDGTLSGTPTALGTSAVTITVTDANRQTATETISLVVTLPSAPGVSFNGLPTTGTAGSQATTPVTFNTTYPVDVTVRLTLTFAPVSGADDPNIQFSTGGRTTTVTVKAGSTTSLTTVGVQTGTVAGVITITGQLIASNGTDITPTPPPTRTITIGPAAPTISSVSGATTSTGFTVTIVGFDPTRSITQVTLTFTPAAGSTLQTTTFTISAQALFSAWYQSSASAQYGSQFSFTIPFTVSGNVSGIASVTVTLTNATGTSAAMTGTV